jgi:hypothetical protein
MARTGTSESLVEILQREDADSTAKKSALIVLARLAKAGDCLHGFRCDGVSEIPQVILASRPPEMTF